MIECRHGERCSGCTLLGVPYAEQLERKRLRVAGELGRYPGLGGVEVAAARGASPFEGYRTRAKWVADRRGALGLFARGGGHEVVDTPGCRVVAPVIARVGDALRGLLGEPGWLRDELKAVDVREVLRRGQRRALVTLVVEGEGPTSPPALRALREAAAAAEALAAACPAVLGVALNVAPRGAPQVLGPQTRRVWGEGEAEDEQGDAVVLASFGAFVQAHRGQAAAMQRAVAGAVGGAVLELYGGSGSLGLAIAARGGEVDSVESFAPASEAAARAARAMGVRLRALAGDAAEALERLRREGKRYDAVVMNPPRRGVSPEVRRAVARLSPGRVVYMSCDPKTLARDLDHLARLGYGAARAEPHDMIPLTDEVETLAVLEPGPPPAARLLHDEAGGLFFEKMGHEPAQGPGSLEERVRAAGHAGAVLVFAPEGPQSGVSLWARGAAEAAAWSAALSAGERVYLALVRGVTSPRGSIRRPLIDRGRRVEATTRYRRRAVVQGHSLLEVRANPGGHRQIERHLASLGHPVLGDERDGHPPSNRHWAEKYGLDRPFLHLSELRLVAPGGGQISVNCPLSADLPAVDAEPGRPGADSG